MAAYLRFTLALLIAALQISCTTFTSPGPPTSLPDAQALTIAAGTVEASMEPAESTLSLLNRETQPQKTARASATLMPTNTLTPTGVLAPTATNAPPNTPIATEFPAAIITPLVAQEIPPAAIQILTPGPASRVRTPFMLRAYLAPGHRGMVRVQLLGEDGRVLMRTVRTYSTRPGLKVYVNAPIDFEISAVAEAARLEVSIDDQNGRIAALASVDLVLLSIGEPELNPAGDLLETIVIQKPTGNDPITGGVLAVSGLARTRTDQPLLIELTTAEGTILATHLVAVEQPQMGAHGDFFVEALYNLASSQKVRISVIERGANIPGIAHLSGLEVILNP